MIGATRGARSKLKSLCFSRATSETTPAEIDRVKNYLNWVEAKTELVINEKEFALPPEITLVQGMKIRRSTSFDEKFVQRGTVLWMDFGENLGQEFSGRHPGLILKIGGETAIVVPLSSQSPTTEQLASGIYAKIDHVYNFTPMTRWANVLNTRAVSIQRFHFKSIGNVKGSVLDNVKVAMKASGVFGS
ncbi:hypothetical protein A8L34_23745 [Bacillus sp. FJAT-27264]|uniref:type II toxin-antitoxin system PemK/MazF family toxin n=1 Tax=Paenibacillus sp. (strain DSM 101736 / FJAT-27264) TaxID=1850362 RepID=UPI000807A8C5|nr:type II toxin-antitoxin system PemK/MazF family toxin [Bacillus sp. FJAT-27264]OBZ08335.1 hypothetical protein A8L34_23745 [Bacillus sp. FJAT-27264]